MHLQGSSQGRVIYTEAAALRDRKVAKRRLHMTPLLPALAEHWHRARTQEVYSQKMASVRRGAAGQRPKMCTDKWTRCVPDQKKHKATGEALLRHSARLKNKKVRA